MRYPMIVFDFDGTLADSLDASLATFNRIAPQLGLKPIEDLAAARMMPTRQLFKQQGVRFWRVPKVVRAFQEAAAETAHEIHLHTGVGDLLARLHEAGHRLGILSSNREATIRTVLHQNRVEQYFAFVVGYPKLFGKAKALRRILRSEKSSPEQMLYVGDELRDLEAARKARIDMAAVTWGFHAESLLAGHSPNYLIRTPGELLGVATS